MGHRLGGLLAAAEVFQVLPPVARDCRAREAAVAVVDQLGVGEVDRRAGSAQVREVRIVVLGTQLVVDLEMAIHARPAASRGHRKASKKMNRSILIILFRKANEMCFFPGGICNGPAVAASEILTQGHLLRVAGHLTQPPPLLMNPLRKLPKFPIFPRSGASMPGSV